MEFENVHDFYDIFTLISQIQLQSPLADEWNGKGMSPLHSEVFCILFQGLNSRTQSRTLESPFPVCVSSDTILDGKK